MEDPATHLKAEEFIIRILVRYEDCVRELLMAEENIYFQNVNMNETKCFSAHFQCYQETKMYTFFEKPKLQVVVFTMSQDSSFF